MVLERLKHIKDQKLSSSTNSNPVRPILLERLEPRILLSGDSLLSAAAPDSLHDMLLDNTQQMVQYAELLDTDEQVEQQLPNAEQEIYREAAIYTLHLDAQEPLDQDSLEGEVVSAQQSESDENPLEESGSGIGIALVLGVDLLDQNDVEPISKDVDSECFESCQRQLILEQLTDTLRIPHGPPDAEGVLTSLDDVQLEYIDAGGQIDLVVRLNTQNSTVIEVFDNNRGVLLASHTLSEINSLTVIGGDNSNDILTVDLSNPFSIPGGIVFVGDDGGYDKLVLIGNSELTAEYVGQGDDDGTVIVSGEEGETTNVSYSGLEPFVYLNEFGAVKNSGIFNYGNSPDILNVGTFSQDSDDTLWIEIGGLTPGPGTPTDNGYDQINVTGTATLDGTLQIELINGFSPSLGQNFEIMTFGSVVGDFATFSGYDLGEGLYLAPVKTAQIYRLDVVDYDPFAADVPKNLNVVIDDLLAAHFDPNVDPDPLGSFVFTSSAGAIPNIITIGGMDLELQDVTLMFSGLEYDFVNARWTGQVAVEATSATLYPGLLGIEVTDDGDDTANGDDADVFAVAGIIYLAVGNSESFLKLDDLEEEDIGWPSFIDIEITDLRLKFDDFRRNDTQNTLNLSAAFLGIDTGNQGLNDLLSADNLFFGLKVTGSVQNLELDMDAIRQGVRNLISGKISFPNSPIVHLGGITGQISGNLFKVARLSAAFIVNTVTYDPDGSSGPLLERSATYLAVEGSFNLGEAITGHKGGGSRDGGFGIAFAFSNLGPLQFFIFGGPIRRFEPTTGLTIEELRFGVSFNTTIEGLQTETDFQATGATVTPDSTGYLVTLTIPDHDLEVGDDFRIINAGSKDYNGDFTVLTFNGDQVTYRLKYDPGEFVGSAQIIRLTIKDPFDLLDEGLQSGIGPPDDIEDWRKQLDQQVRNQLEAGDDIWARLFGEVTFGGGATLSIDPIPDYILLYDVDLLIDTDLRIFLKGEENLFDGLVKFPTRLYADLSELNKGSGRFLYLETQPEIPMFEPLLVYRGELSFEALVGTDVLNATVTDNTANGFWQMDLELALDYPSSEYSIGDNAVIFGSNPSTFDWTYEVIAVDDDTNTITVQINCDLDGNGVCDPDEISAAYPGTWIGGGKVSNENALVGFRIVLEGGVDLNIPGFDASWNPITVTTLTLEGKVAVEFRVPGPSVPEDLQIELSFKVALSETHVGIIADAAGMFVVTLDVDAPPEEFIVIYGAARLTTQLDFLENVGLFMDVSGFLRINSGDQDTSITLLDINNNPVEVALPAQSFALRLSGYIDFRIDFNGNDEFEPIEESVFLLEGIFVLEFSAEQGFNVAVFREVGESVGPATLKIGPASSPFLQFDVFGFLAIRPLGIAANMILSLDASLPGALASVANLNGQFVFMVNTTFTDVSFTIPGNAAGPNRPGLTVMIPRAPPESITDASLNVFALIAGNAWTVPASTVGGAYVLIHMGGTHPDTDPDASLTVGAFNLRGKFSFLLGATVHTDGSIHLLLEISAEYSLTISAGPMTFFSFDGTGFLRFDNSGLVASFSLNQASGVPPSFGFNFGGSSSFDLEINTTGASVDHDNNPSTPAIQPGLRLHITGMLQIGSVLDLSGTFDLTIDSGEFTIELNAIISVFGTTLEVHGFAGIYYGDYPGFAFKIQLKLGSSNGVTVSPCSGFTISGAFLLEINTSNAVRDGIARMSFKIGVTDLVVNLFGFELSGSLTIGISSAGLSIDIPAPGLTLDFFGIVTLSVSGYLHTDHHFSFTASAEFTLLNPNIFGFYGEIWVAFSDISITHKVHGVNQTFPAGFAGGLNGTFGAFGIKVSAGGVFFIGSGLVKIDVFISLQITPAFSFKVWTPWKTYTVYVPAVVVSGHWTKTFGALTTAPEIPSAPVLATVVGGNILRLNIGADAGARGSFYPAVDESYIITREGSGTSTISDKLKVSALGFDQIYDNITHILVNNTQSWDDLIGIGSAVTTTVSINVGVTATGNNHFINAGSGALTAQGGSGSNWVEAGPGGGTYTGGPGNSNIEDDPAGLLTVKAPGYDAYLLTDDSLTYGDGSTITHVMTLVDVETVILNGAADATYETSSLPDPDTGISTPWTGTATFNGTGASSTVRANSAGNLALTNTSLTETPGVTITLSNINIANLYGEDGANTFNVSGWTKSGLLDGGGGTDTVVAANNANFTLTDTLLARSSGGSFTLDSIELAELTGGSNANSFSVSNWTGTATLNGAGNSDTYTVDLKGSGSGTTTINDSSGNDSATVNGTSSADTIVITTTQVTRGSETVNYTSTETLVVNGNDGIDIFQVTDTSITTTINGNAGNDQFTVSDNHSTLTLNGNAGNDQFTINDSNSTLIVNGDANDDQFTVNGNSFALTLNGNDDSDTMTVNATRAALTMNGGDGDDTFNVRSIGAVATINAGSGSDTINVGSGSSNVNEIAALLTVNGNEPSSGSDIINVDDTGDTSGNPGNPGNLTSTQLYGLGMASGITYGTIETLNISLGSGEDTFTIQSTHSGSTTVSTGAGADTIVINGADGTLTVNGQADDDVFTVNGTGASSSSMLNGQAGNDTFNIKAINGPVVVSGGGDSDTINVGSDGATVTVTVTPENKAPVANDDSAGTPEDTAVTIDVLANDTDEDAGDPPLMSVAFVTQGANGTVTNNGTDVTYTPAADFNGVDSFTYTASDGNGGFDSATVTITVNPAAPTTPVPVDDLVSVSCGLVGYDRRTGQFSVNLTVTNKSDKVISGPIWLVIDKISDSSITLANADGTTSDGKRYIDLSKYLSDGRLDPGESATVRLYFYNPKRLRFTFQPTVRGII